MIASAPNTSASFVNVIDAAVLLLPVPAITGTRLFTTSITCLNNAIFSSSNNVGDSPVVPATTSPSVPFASKSSINTVVTSKSILPSVSNGVTIAVSTVPKPISFTFLFYDLFYITLISDLSCSVQMHHVRHLQHFLYLLL